MLLYDYVTEHKNGSSILRASSQLSQIQLRDRPNLKVLAEKLKELNSSESRHIFHVRNLLNLPLYSECEAANYENATGYYITTIKILVRELSAGTLNQLFDPETGDFPLLESLLQCSHHEDDMIKNAARLSLLNVFSKCRGEVLQMAIPFHLTTIISLLKRTSLEVEEQERGGNSLRCSIERYEQELEYVDDILCLEQKVVVAARANALFLHQFVVQFLFSAITEQNSVITSKTSLFLLAKLMKTMSNKEITRNITLFLLPYKIKEKPTKSCPEDYEGVSIKTILELRHKMIVDIKKVGSSAELSSLCTVEILKVVFSSLDIYHRNRIFLFYRTYFKLLFDSFSSKNDLLSEIDKIKLSCKSSILSEIIKNILKNNGITWCQLRNHLSQKLRYLYQLISQNLTINNVIEFSSEVDEQYIKFIENEENAALNYTFYFKGIQLEKHKYSKTESNLIKLFYLRRLCLLLNEKTERILPFLPEKIKIGQTMCNDNSILCKVLSQSHVYVSNHFIKLTPSQFLVLQFKRHDQGTVIYSSYYKDVKWAKYKNNSLLLWDNSSSKNLNIKSKSETPTIFLKFEKIDNYITVTQTLGKAKSKQSEIILKKINDLLEIEVKSQEQYDNS